MSVTKPLLRLTPLLALLIYSGLALYQLDLPGFYYDEALDLPASIHLAQGQPPALSPGDPGLTLGPTTYPLMILDYLGAAYTYLLWPVFVFIGASWLSVRWFEVLLGAIILALSHRLARVWFGPAVAALTVLLVAVNPSFIFWTRMGISVTHLMSVCAIGSLLAWHHWTKTTRPRWLFLFGFLLGLGLWAKFLFLWWLTSLALCAALWFWLTLARTGALPRPTPALGWRPLALAALGFSLGAAPLIYYNLRTGLTYQILLNALTRPTAYGVSNTNFLANLRAAWEQFHIFIDGSYFWYNGAIHANSLAFPMWLLANAVVCFLAPRWPRARFQRTAVIVILIAAITFQSAFTVSGIWATHLYIIIPFLQIIPALAIVHLPSLFTFHASRFPSSFFLRSIPAFFFLLSDLLTTARYHASLTRTGGIGRFSDAIYQLADYLDHNNLISPAALDWGLQKNLLILTNGRVIPIEIFGYSAEPDPGFAERMLFSVCDGCVFISTAPAHAVYPRDAAFREQLAALGYTIAEELTFTERSGAAAYVAYKIKPTP